MCVFPIAQRNCNKVEDFLVFIEEFFVQLSFLITRYCLDEVFQTAKQMLSEFIFSLLEFGWKS